MTYARMHRCLEEMVDQIPPLFLEQLNGGISLLEEVKPDEQLHDVYILGEYIDQPYGLGSLIVLYYGSFAATLAGEPESVWKRELWETLLHELQHHVEALAGMGDLQVEDEARFEAWLKEEGEAR